MTSGSYLAVMKRVQTWILTKKELLYTDVEVEKKKDTKYSNHGEITKEKKN